MARETEPALCTDPIEDRRTKPSQEKEAEPMVHLAAHAATPYAWIASLQFPAVEPVVRQPRPQPQMPRTDRAEPMRLDRDTARAMVDAGFMPLSRYIQMFEADDDEPSCIDEVEH